MSDSLVVQALLRASAIQAHMFGQLLRGEPTSYPTWCCQCGDQSQPARRCPVHERKPDERA